MSLSARLLRQIDAIARYQYVSRSHTIRQAVLHWIASDQKLRRVADRADGKSGLTREEELKQILSPEQIDLLTKFKNNEIEYEVLFEHITTDIFFKLLDMGEI